MNIWNVRISLRAASKPMYGLCVLCYDYAEEIPYALACNADESCEDSIGVPSSSMNIMHIRREFYLWTETGKVTTLLAAPTFSEIKR